MRRSLFYVVVVAIMLTSCSIISPNSHKVVKPRYRHGWFNLKHGWYNHKKDKKAKRTKVVRMKS